MAMLKNGDLEHLNLLKDKVESAFLEYLRTHKKNLVGLENAFEEIHPSESNDLRLFVMEKLNQGTEFQYNYYQAAQGIIHSLCGNELTMQKRPGLSINLPKSHNDILPIHADTWNGVSPYELNIWIPLVDCSQSMSLYP